MQRLVLKNLLLSSLILLLCSCSLTKGYLPAGEKTISANDIKPIISDSTLLYKTQIKIYNKYYSGLILLKKTDSATSHLVFVAELGMKMFDYQIKNRELSLVYVFEPLNKPQILKLLEYDFKYLLFQNLLFHKVNSYSNPHTMDTVYKSNDSLNFKAYYFKNTAATINKIIIKKGIFIKEKICYCYNDKHIANNIYLRHKGFFPLKIELSLISK